MRRPRVIHVNAELLVMVESYLREGTQPHPFSSELTRHNLRWAIRHYLAMLEGASVLSNSCRPATIVENPWQCSFSCEEKSRFRSALEPGRKCGSPLRTALYPVQQYVPVPVLDSPTVLFLMRLAAGVDSVDPVISEGAMAGFAIGARAIAGAFAASLGCLSTLNSEAVESVAAAAVIEIPAWTNVPHAGFIEDRFSEFLKAASEYWDLCHEWSRDACLTTDY